MSYLRLWGTVAGGWLMARAAIAAKADLAKNEGDPDFLRAKILTARFYGEQILPRASSLKAAAKEVGATVKTSELVSPSSQVPDIGSMSGAGAVAFLDAQFF